jgi:hypothetical protein
MCAVFCEGDSTMLPWLIGLSVAMWGQTVLNFMLLKVNRDQNKSIQAHQATLGEHQKTLRAIISSAGLPSWKNVAKVTMEDD